MYELIDFMKLRPVGKLAIKQEQQCVHFDRVEEAVIISHGKSKTCPSVGLGGEKPVPLLLIFERPVLHEKAVKLRTDCVRPRVTLEVKHGRWWLVARDVGHNLAGPYKTHGNNIG